MRGEREYYAGVGLGDHDWRDQAPGLTGSGGTDEAGKLGGNEGGGPSEWFLGCDVTRRHPCAEDWAVALAGRRMASILTAPDYASLQARARLLLHHHMRRRDRMHRHATEIRSVPIGTEISPS